jgi:hypothetical protein
MSIISKGNHKLSRAVGIFNLPSGKTCPGATAECRKLCYAKKPERYSKQALASRMANLELSKQPDFVDLMVAEIAKAKVNFVRLHESGDVYDQAYLDKLYQICKLLQGSVRFLMYTKSFHLDWSGKPDNLTLYASTTDSTDLSRVPAGWPRAHLVLKGMQPPAGYVTCQPKSATGYCGKDCFTCFFGLENVYFEQH